MHLVLFIGFDSLGIPAQKLSKEMFILLHEPNLKLTQGDILCNREICDIVLRLKMTKFSFDRIFDAEITKPWKLPPPHTHTKKGR